MTDLHFMEIKKYIDIYMQSSLLLSLSDIICIFWYLTSIIIVLLCFAILCFVYVLHVIKFYLSVALYK